MFRHNRRCHPNRNRLSRLTIHCFSLHPFVLLDPFSESALLQLDLVGGLVLAQALGGGLAHHAGAGSSGRIRSRRPGPCAPKACCIPCAGWRRRQRGLALVSAFFNRGMTRRTVSAAKPAPTCNSKSAPRYCRMALSGLPAVLVFILSHDRSAYVFSCNRLVRFNPHTLCGASVMKTDRVGFLLFNHRCRSCCKAPNALTLNQGLADPWRQGFPSKESSDLALSQLADRLVP